MSYAYHPQTDRQTEVLNQCLETYLRCFASSWKKQWGHWLLWAKYWYNTSYQIAMRMTTFEIVYGLPHPLYIAMNAGLLWWHRLKIIYMIGMLY